MTTPSFDRRLRFVLAALLLTAAAPAAVERFQAQPADDYSRKQSQGAVTVAIEAFHDEAAAKELFGKAQPGKIGVLPVLLVISNQGDRPIKLDNLRVRYVPSPGTEGIEALRGSDLATFNPKGYQPKQRKIPGVGTTRAKVKKGPLARPEVAEREWSAPLVPPGVQESGFFFFHVGGAGNPAPSASIYVTGLYDMKAGQELFYFEIPLGR